MAEGKKDIGALWVREPRSGGAKYMKGKVTCPHCAAETGIVVFPNRHRKSDKHPNARIYQDQPIEQQASEPPLSESGFTSPPGEEGNFF